MLSGYKNTQLVVALFWVKNEPSTLDIMESMLLITKITQKTTSSIAKFRSLPDEWGPQYKSLCLTCGVHKSHTPDHVGKKILYDGAQYLSVLSVELASCHPSCT
jgi:hypothetical protein